MTSQLVELVEPKRTPSSDLNGHVERRRIRWLSIVGWSLFALVACFPFGIAFVDGIRSARADAEFRRQMARDEREMKAILAELSRGNADQKRLAREIEDIRRRHK